MYSQQTKTSDNKSGFSPAASSGTGLSLQCKMDIASVNDPLEAEADEMADRVMRMPDIPLVQRKCAGCEEEEKEKLQRKPLAASITPFIQTKGTEVDTASDAVTSQIDASKGNGGSMDKPTQSFMETRFSTDFSNVKIHTDDQSVNLNRELNAKAFTVGNDIYFNEGQYNPGSDSGKHLLAHELTHTIQQGSVIQKSVQRSVESDANRIESILSYGIFDWAITDAEAIEALEILSNLSPDLQQSVLRRINIGRLRENLPRAYLTILERILAVTSSPPANVTQIVERIQNLLSYSIFDWAITDSDAREAFRLLNSLSPEEQQRVILVINYDRLYENLPDEADRVSLAAMRRTATAFEATEQARMDALRVRARNIVTQLKAAADGMTLPPAPAAGAFEQFLGQYYLTEYCANSSSATASTAKDRITQEGQGGFSHYGFGLLRGMADHAALLGINYIDSPYLLGRPAMVTTATGALFDPWSQGPNLTQLMHFAAGVKWSWMPTALVQWYFVHYEETTEEGWQLFGLDSLNDVIAEEGARLFSEDLSSGSIRCTGGLIDFDAYFARGRSFLRSRINEADIDRLAMRMHLQNLVVGTNPDGSAQVNRPLYQMTIMEQLMAGYPDGVVLASSDAGVLTLLFHLARRG